MRNLLLIIGIVFSAQAVAEGGIYRSVGPDGEIIFSDTPSPGAIQLEKKEVPTVPATMPAPPPPRQTADSDRTGDYKRVEIVTPENDSIVRDNQGNVSVNVAVEPSLAADAGHELVLYLDGNEANRGQVPGFQLTEVNPGTHSLAVAVVDGQGRELKRSSSINFTLLKHSALHPTPQAPGTMPGPGGLNPGSKTPGVSN